MRASVLGYCMGVRRAMAAAEKALKAYPESDVYTLGPLIHNKTALEDLAARGLLTLADENAEALPAGTLCGAKKRTDIVVILRAHGAAPQVRGKLKKAGARIIDATCPRVLANQRRVKAYALKEYLIIIAGDKNHAEVSALVGEARDAGAECRIVQNEDEAEALAQNPHFRCCNAILISQTTISAEEYKAIQRILREAHDEKAELKIFDTICPATEERQKALKELCRKAEGVLVVGGKNSANTKRLFQTASALCAHAAHIETAREIPAEFRRLKTIGITAGASTPDSVIREVERSLCALPAAEAVP